MSENVTFCFVFVRCYVIARRKNLRLSACHLNILWWFATQRLFVIKHHWQLFISITFNLNSTFRFATKLDKNHQFMCVLRVFEKEKRKIDETKSHLNSQSLNLMVETLLWLKFDGYCLYWVKMNKRGWKLYLLKTLLFEVINESLH